MRILKKLLIGSENNVMRRSAIWNLISSVEYSLQSVVLLLFVTRFGGLYEAGMFTIAYTVTQMMTTIGNYGMREFQVSDTKLEYKFGTYLCSRIISVIIMGLVCVCYAVLQGYDTKKMWSLFFLCMYRVAEDIEDVFHGEMQKSMRLDIAAKIVSIRIFVATVIFGIVYIMTSDLACASFALAVTAVALALVLNVAVKDKFQRITIKLSFNRTGKLLWICLPLCLSAFLYNYLANAPKYAIDRNLSEEMQAMFSILFMPIFVINLLSSFIFKPMIANMGMMWNRRKFEEFLGTVVRQLLLIVGLTAGIMFAGIWLGIDILNCLYGVELTQYRRIFGMLLFFGGFAAIDAFLMVVLTIVRKQKYIIIAYGISAVITLLLADDLVVRYEIMGAGIIYGVSMGTIMLILMVTLIITLIEKRNLRGDNKSGK